MRSRFHFKDGYFAVKARGRLEWHSMETWLTVAQTCRWEGLHSVTLYTVRTKGRPLFKNMLIIITWQFFPSARHNKGRVTVQWCVREKGWVVVVVAWLVFSGFPQKKSPHCILEILHYWPLDLWPLKSYQFILESEWTFEQILKKIPQGALEIFRLQGRPRRPDNRFGGFK